MNISQIGIRCQAVHQAYGLTTELQNMSTSLRMIVVCEYTVEQRS